MTAESTVYEILNNRTHKMLPRYYSADDATRFLNINSDMAEDYTVYPVGGGSVIVGTDWLAAHTAAEGSDGPDGDGGTAEAVGTFDINDLVTYEGRTLRVIATLSSGELILFDDARNVEVQRLFHDDELTPAPLPEPTPEPPAKRFDIEIITFDVEEPAQVAEARNKMMHLRSLGYRYVSTTSAGASTAGSWGETVSNIITTVIMELEGE